MIGFWNYTVVLTYIALLSGGAGIAFASTGTSWGIWASVCCLLISGVCDLFDGAVARTKKDRTEQQKAFGIQIDSLSDLVCFGVLPAVMMYSMSGFIGMNNVLRQCIFIPIAAVYILFGLVRLAYFNVLAEEAEDAIAAGEAPKKKFFWGMPITMASLIVPTCFAIEVIVEKIFNQVTFSMSYIYAAFILIIAILFVVRVKIPKLGKNGMIILASIGTVLFITMIILACI